MRGDLGRNLPLIKLGDRVRRNSHLLGYHFNPNDYFLMADFRGFPADLGDLGYGMLSH